MMQKGLRQVGDRIAVRDDVLQQPTRHQHEIVVHHVATRHLDGFDQAQRRLFAEGAGKHHTAIVAQWSVFRFGRRQIVAHQAGMCLDR